MGQILGYTIDVSSVKPCKYGCACTRERWYVASWYQGGEIGQKAKDKPKVHWHIKFGAKWKDDRKSIKFSFLHV